VPLDEVAPWELVDPRTPADSVLAGDALARLEREARSELGPGEWGILLAYALERGRADAPQKGPALSAVALRSRVARARRRLLGASPYAAGDAPAE
jgi:hypothetical protein